MAGDKVRKVARNPLRLLNREETGGEQRQKQRVRVEVTEIVQMRCASSLEKGACVHAKVLQLCQTLRHCGLVPARLLCPWGSPGKNTGVGCHALLQVHKDGSSATGESDQTLNIF